MALLKILHYPDERLRTQAKPVDTVDNSIKQLVDDMFETMYAAPGIGLAATQVDHHVRVIVLDISEDKSEPLCLINPEITATEGEVKTEEGCLSVPSIYEKVVRAEKIHIKALDRDGKPFEMDADDILAVCIQHECDHLDGKLFVDYLSSLKMNRVKKKIAKHRKETL